MQRGDWLRSHNWAGLESRMASWVRVKVRQGVAAEARVPTSSLAPQLHSTRPGASGSHRSHPQPPMHPREGSRISLQNLEQPLASASWDSKFQVSPACSSRPPWIRSSCLRATRPPLAFRVTSLSSPQTQLMFVRAHLMYYCVLSS